MSAATTVPGAMSGIAPGQEPASGQESFAVHVADLDARLRVAAGETLLDGALRSGVALPHDCRAGGCGACRIRVRAGMIRYEAEPFALTPEEAGDGYALACQAFAASDLVVERAPPAPDLPEPSVFGAQVVEIARLAEGVTRLVLDSPDAAGVGWVPGQYLNILAPDGPRSFSMAAQPAGGRFELHIRTIAGGGFTAGRLPHLRPGDRLDVELPLGRFVRALEETGPLLLVATGTGIAPFRAMLQSILVAGAPAPPARLYWGMRTRADLYLHDELAALQQELASFTYVPILSRADAAWSGRRGHVQDVVLEDFADLSEHDIYLCGTPDMIRAAGTLFLARGADGARLHAEGFTLRAGAPAFQGGNGTQEQQEGAAHGA